MESDKEGADQVFAVLMEYKVKSLINYKFYYKVKSGEYLASFLFS